MGSDRTRKTAKGEASPYSTGGGGTVLEHRYGAVLLAHLLAGDPVPELGDDASPVAIHFQASAFSPVDDLVVVGRVPDGDRRRVSIGVRRAPRLTSRDDDSAALVGSYLKIVRQEWEHVKAGRWRLALAVASPNVAVKQVGELASIARASGGDVAFREAVKRPAATNHSVRARLSHVGKLVEAAAAELEIDDVAADELTWRLLYGLRVREVRLEGADQSDRTFAVSRVRSVTAEATPAAADGLFARLEELVGGYAPTAARVDETALRRDLSGVPLARAPSRAAAWKVVDGLANRLLDRTRFRLRDAQAEVELERAAAREGLTGQMRQAATDRSGLVVVGEPDVGKSALAVRAGEQLAAGGTAVSFVSLRDLPPSALEFESLLGDELTAVFGAMAVGDGRLVVVDGAEAVLEGRQPLLLDLAAAAFRTGHGVAAVTRRDGAAAVAKALASAMDIAGSSLPMAEHEVPALTFGEMEEIATAFPSLAPLLADERAGWLLARPGLVELLLKAGGAPTLPSGPLSEAHVYASVWRYLVRRDEVTAAGGPAPDARERTLVSLARKLLLPDTPQAGSEASALPSLRSDGLLLAAGPTVAWTAGDEFASDLVRDLAVARLLILEGIGVIEAAGGPRWAIRAARLACQSRLLDGSLAENVWLSLESAYAELAAQHGQRWAEVPFEALLTLGSAKGTLVRIWPTLLASDAGLPTLLRLALQRYTKYGVGETSILEPLVELSFCGDANLGQHDRYSRGTGEQIRDLVLAWLRGVAGVDRSVPVRQQVRDRIVESAPPPYDDFAVEALATLGRDLEERAEAFLRNLVEEGAGHLAPAVETPGAVAALSQHQPELLLELTEAFYKQSPRDSFGSLLDDGIRRHHRAGGAGVPMAAWYFGPFFRLLNTKPAEALSLVNRLLDHAAAVRVKHSSRWDEAPGGEAAAGIDLDLPRGGMRHCVGDGHVWGWYRGSTVGPYPCMSALLATERFADHLVDTLGLPLCGVVELLLRDCHNLAMPGLVVGLVERHFDKAGKLLDRWLTYPELWHLELSRATQEGMLHVQGRDPDEVVGRERRGMTFHDVAGKLTMRAIVSNDERRLAELADVSEALVERARDLELEDPEDLATVENWAAMLRAENYQRSETAEGDVVIEYQQPEPIAEAFRPTVTSLARGNEAYRLQLKYALDERGDAPVETLLEDIRLAKELAVDPPAHGPLQPEEAVAGVAAAAILAHSEGRAVVAERDLVWAGRFLTEVALRSEDGREEAESSRYPARAERSAAAALPALLVPPLDDLPIDRDSVAEGLARCTASNLDEVRAVLAEALDRVWESPCDGGVRGAVCRHAVAWHAVEEGLRYCRLGDWTEAAQRRPFAPLRRPLDQTLAAVPENRLLKNRLTAPLLATAGAARHTSCVRDAALTLRRPIFEAYARAAVHWAEKGYDERDDDDRRRVARLLVERFIRGEGEELLDYIRQFSANARALHELLADLAQLVTYDEQLRRSLPEVWPPLLRAALDALEERGSHSPRDDYWWDLAVAALVPTPQINLIDRDPDATLDRAYETWISPDALAEQIPRWLEVARGEPKAADAVARLARGAPEPWQATTGLEWVEELIGGQYDRFARRCWFVTDWLKDLRGTRHLAGTALARWRRVVDGMAAAGDDRAAELQRAEE